MHPLLSDQPADEPRYLMLVVGFNYPQISELKTTSTEAESVAIGVVQRISLIVF